MSLFTYAQVELIEKSLKAIHEGGKVSDVLGELEASGVITTEEILAKLAGNGVRQWWKDDKYHKTTSTLDGPLN